MAPRPGLEPGTNRLTVLKSAYSPNLYHLIPTNINYYKTITYVIIYLYLTILK